MLIVADHSFQLTDIYLRLKVRLLQNTKSRGRVGCLAHNQMMIVKAVMENLLRNHLDLFYIVVTFEFRCRANGISMDFLTAPSHKAKSGVTEQVGKSV